MKYSVIIPVYNAENTLARCLDSLLESEWLNAEILLIDDGSTDRSPGICRAYAARDSRIRFLTKENGGVSSARNAGLDMAKGEFVLFVDSDDHVEPDYFARLDAIDPKGVYDYLLFSYYRTDGTTRSERVQAPFASTDPGEYGPRLAWAYYSKRINSPWNKRYRRSILEAHRLRFHPALPIAEDALFNLQYLLHSSGCCMSDTRLYCVSLENGNSLSRRPRTDREPLLTLADREMLRAIESADICETFRSQMLEARNFLLLSNIYSAGKQYHLSGTKVLVRRKLLREQCVAFNRLKLPLPRTRYCQLLALPVRLKAAFLIDLMARRLAR